MSYVLDMLRRYPASTFIDLATGSGEFSAGARPVTLALNEQAVSISYHLPTERMLKQGLSDAFMAAVANDVATLLVRASQPPGTSWRKVSLAVEFVAPPANCELVVKNVGQPLSWAADAGPQAVGLEGRSANDQLVFTAAMTVTVSV